MTRAAMILMSLILAGCGAATADDGRGPTGPLSGTRLQVRTWTGADGSRLPVALYDTELGVDCEPRIASDGVTRCLPVGLPSLETIRRETDVWADPGRTTPAWDTERDRGFYTIPVEGWSDWPEFYCASMAPPMVQDDASGSCGVSIYEVVDAAEAHAEWGPTDAAGIVTIGPEIPPEIFVEMSPSH